MPPLGVGGTLALDGLSHRCNYNNVILVLAGALCKWKLCFPTPLRAVANLAAKTGRLCGGDRTAIRKALRSPYKT